MKSELSVMPPSVQMSLLAGTARRTRVCHVQVLPILSGVQRAMLEMFSHVDRERYELHVACQEPGPLTDELDRQDIAWHAIPSLGRPLRPKRDWQAYRQLRQLFDAWQFDIVHTHSSKPGVLGRLAARASGVPHVIHHVHAFAFHEFSPPHKRFVYSQIERLVGRYCDRVLFVNREERVLAVERGWLPAEKCQTIYNGVDLAAFHPLRGVAPRRAYRQRWQCAAEEVVILFVGRLDYPKQPRLIPEIGRCLRQLRPDVAWRLLVAGDGPEEAAVAARIEELALGDRVQLLGWQQDPQGILHAADVVLLTSLAEGLPLALIEAQAAARPVVASRAKGIREVVVPGTGYLCPPTDPQGYAERLAELIDNAARRAELGQAARRHAEQKFDTRENAAQVARLYDQMIGASPRVVSLRRAA